MRKTTLIALIFFAGFLSKDILFAAETKKPTSVPPAKVAPQKPEVPQVQPAAHVAVASGSTYSYNPVGKPDPFRPFIDDEIAAKKKVEKKKVTRSIYPLQGSEVGQFRVVGISDDQNRRIAVVQDATKKHYPLSVGTQIGVNQGKVVEILPDRVIVEEYKTKKAKRIILKLHKNQDEVKP
ncbi:MAG: hypothetical protein CVU52_00425 [Deltaproteobacteria bacterium HGW-Deltaproteobacteria-10]|nr:MAG: hypothetical protein CVU52_00425 [Deltaproteobacteria bacterium HGW-Deltaproteobacteria-10]